jgi:hypothetical protein
MGEVGVERDEVCHCEGDFGDRDVLMPVIVAEASHELFKAKTSREEAMVVVQGVIANRGDEAGDGGDLVTSGGEGCDNETEIVFGEWERGIDAEFGAKSSECALL